MNQIEWADALLLQVRNHHSVAAGRPPRIDDRNANHYVGYFENAHGEQALVVFDREARAGTLYLGDAGWENAHAVVDGTAPDLVLSETELLWLGACWGLPPKRFSSGMIRSRERLVWLAAAVSRAFREPFPAC